MRRTRDLRRRRRRTDAPRPAKQVVAGLVVTALVGCFVAFGTSAQNGVPTASYDEVFAKFEDVGNLKAHDEVRIAGTRVGQVLDTTTDGRTSTVKVQLESGIGALPADTTAEVRGRGLLGTRFLELRPGTSRASLAPGATIASAEVGVTNGVPDVLDTFDRQTRGELGNVIKGLGGSLAGNGRRLNDNIGFAPELLGGIERLGTEVLRDREAAETFLPKASRGLAAFDGAREELAWSLRPFADGVQVFEDHRDGVHRTLSETPTTLASARSGLTAGRRVLTAVRDLTTAVEGTLPAAPAALEQTARTLRRSRPGLDATTDLLGGLRPTVPHVLRITRAVSPQLKPFRAALDTALPLVRTLGARSCDVQQFAAHWRSSLGTGTVGGNDIGGDTGPLNQFRIHLIAGPNALTGLSPTPVPFADTDFYAPNCIDAGKRWSRLGEDEGSAR